MRLLQSINHWTTIMCGCRTIIGHDGLSDSGESRHHLWDVCRAYRSHDPGWLGENLDVDEVNQTSGEADLPWRGREG